MTTAEQTDAKDVVERLQGVACDRQPFTPEHAECICRLANKAADLIERLSRELEEARATSDRLADSNYLAGATFGWNCAMEGAVEKFNAALRARAALSPKTEIEPGKDGGT